MGMASDANGDIVLFGGDATDQHGTVTYFDDTWTWDGSTWTERHPATSPSARCCFGLAYDAGRQQTILFGGSHDSYLSDTWAWDGAAWTELYPGTSPPGTYAPGLAYDAARREIMLFGDYWGYSIDTWTWDGTTWQKETVGTLPPYRARMGMAYDAARRVVTMFGGEYECFEATCWLNDTWSWNGTNWKQDHPARAPSKRSEVGMAYDAGKRRMVLFGGQCLCRDTWIWDGLNWTRATPVDSPLGREAPGMVWDGARRQIVLFGGRDYPNGFTRDFGDTWIWGGFNWFCVAGCT
jgi:hypothetical protein